MKKWRCTVCGYFHEGPEPPDTCPVCGADKSLFEAVGEESEKPAEPEKDASGDIKKWRCTVCGYIHEGPEPPDKCPVCGADKRLFEAVDAPSDPAPEPSPPAADAPPETEAEKPAGKTVVKWRCTVCGYIHEGPEPPDKCPICGADKRLFEPYETLSEGNAGAESTTATPPSTARNIDLGPEPDDSKGRLYHRMITQMLKHHAHPISVHIPNGVLPLSFIFLTLAGIFECRTLETAYICNMVFVVLTMPLVLFSGYIEWQKRYKGFLSDRFLTKILCATVVAVLSVVAVVWWMVHPDVLQSDGRWVFLLVNLIMLAAAAIAGLIGGKLVFKD